MRQGVGPGVEARLILTRHAEQLADDRNRQRIGKIVDDIEPALVAVSVEQLVDEGHDPVVHGVDAGRGELTHHQPSQPIVLRRIEEEEWARFDPLRADKRNLGLTLVLAHSWVVQQCGDIGIAADGEEAIRQRGDRSLAQPGVERVRVGTVDRVEDLREKIRGSSQSLAA